MESSGKSSLKRDKRLMSDIKAWEDLKGAATVVPPLLVWKRGSERVARTSNLSCILLPPPVLKNVQNVLICEPFF